MDQQAVGVFIPGFFDGIFYEPGAGRINAAINGDGDYFLTLNGSVVNEEKENIGKDRFHDESRKERNPAKLITCNLLNIVQVSV